MELDLLNLDDIQPPHLLEDGTYKLEIMKEPEKKESKNNPGRFSIVVYLRAVDDPDAEMLSEYLTLPVADDKPDVVKMFGRRIKDFCTAFGIPFEGGSAKFESAKGATGWAMVKKEYNEKMDREVNTCKRFILPK